MEEYFEEQFKEDETIDYMRYIKVFIRRWWLITLIFLGVSIPWLLYVKRQPPVYQAETWISFENVVGGVPQNLIQSRIMKLKSRSFAEEVTAQIGLTLQLVQENNKNYIGRQDVFDTFFTSKDPVPGNYTIYFYPAGYCSFFLGKKRLDSLETKEFVDYSVTYNGITFSLNPVIINNRSRVDFLIKNFQATVEFLISKEEITTNREGNLMRITLKDKDPVLASKTVNMLAGIFAQKSLDMRKETRRLIRNYLQEQLSVVEKELNKSDIQLKSFRDSHLTGLDHETENSITQLNNLEGQINRLNLQKEELDILLNKLDPSLSEFDTDVSASYIYRQIAGQRIFDQDATMTIAQQELADLNRSRAELLQRGFPERNPTVLEFSENIQLIEEKIYRLARDKIKELENQIVSLNERMEEFQKKLNTLPEEELRFIKLTRQRRVNEEIHALLLKRYKEAQISEAVATENVSILDPAVPPHRPISGGKRKKALVGMFIGFLLGVSSAFIWEVADKSIKTREDVKRYLRLPMLGIIPKVKFDDYELQDSEKAKSISSQIVTHDYSPTPVGEAYRSLRTNLLFSKNIGTIRSLVIGSVSPGEGKSFTAANLAITMAQQKSRTLLIDTDLRRGVMHNTFNCAKKPGLTNYLTGVAPLEKVLNGTYVPNLSLITCGSLIPNPSELLGSTNMRKFLEDITKRFDFIVFDTPPLIAATDAVILGTIVDGVAVLIRAGKTNREEVQRRLELFQNVQAKIIGAILNGVGVEVAHEGYSYYAY